jgi:hypothetical protein
MRATGINHVRIGADVVAQETEGLSARLHTWRGGLATLREG